MRNLLNRVRRMFATPLRAALAAGIVSAFVVGGLAVANASIPDSNGVIDGCYGAAGSGGLHSLSVVSSTKTCPAGTTSIGWNQTGPSNAYTTTGGYYSDISSYTTVASLALPAGSYTFSATIPLSSVVASAVFFSCYLGGPNGTINSGYYTTPPFPGGNNALYTSIPITGAMTITAGTVSINCYTSGSSASAYISGANLTATTTGDLTTS